jgi:hypothetical protein
MYIYVTHGYLYMELLNIDKLHPCTYISSTYVLKSVTRVLRLHVTGTYICYTCVLIDVYTLVNTSYKRVIWYTRSTIHASHLGVYLYLLTL